MDLKELVSLNNMIVNMIIEYDINDGVNCTFKKDNSGFCFISIDVYAYGSYHHELKHCSFFVSLNHTVDGSHRKIYVLEHYLKGNIDFDELKKELSK